MENNELITKAIRYIQKNPKENLLLQSIAENAGFSLTYFDLLFHKHTGYSPVEYSRVYKLTRSALELRRSDKSVLDIALDFGYQSPESFSRAFKSFYSMTPSEYREKFSQKAVTWHDLSSQITLSRFGKEFPMLKPVSHESALDYMFTHDRLKFGENLIGLTVADTAVLTLDDPDNLQSFICVSDYNDAEPAVDLVCIDEDSAIRYLDILSKTDRVDFKMRVEPGTEWERFNAAAAATRLLCKVSYDMMYLEKTALPAKSDNVRELNPQDTPLIRQFKERGGCGENHIRAIEIAFDRKGNEGMRSVGLFRDGEITALAMPQLDVVRDFRKYDIGAIFTLDGVRAKQDVEAVWRFVISMSISDNAYIGNADAKDDDSPLGVDTCEKMGLTKVAESRRYTK